MLEVGGGPGELAARMRRELGCDVVMVDVSSRMVELARARGVDAQVGDVQELPFDETGRSTARSPPGCSSTSRTSTAGWRSWRACCGPAAGSSRSRTRRNICASCARSPERRLGPRVHARERRGTPRAPLRRVERRDADGWVTITDEETVQRVPRLAAARRLAIDARGRTSSRCESAGDLDLRRGEGRGDPRRRR